MAWETQYLQSIWMPEIQYFDWRVWWEVNKIFSNIINCDWYKCPWFQQSHIEDLWINWKEKWDKDFVFLKKREWFTLMDVDNDFDWYELVDAITINNDWREYYLAISFDKTKLKIWRLKNSVLSDVTTSFYWWWVDDFFKFKKWLSEKFTKTYLPWWEQRSIFASWWTAIVSSWGIKRWSEELWYYFTDNDVDNHTTMFNSASVLPWDYLYLINTWEVWVITEIHEDKIKIAWVWIMPITWTDPAIWDIQYTIFSKRTEVFIFQTIKWPIAWHSTWWIEMYQLWWLYWGNLEISSMINYQDNIYFIDKKSWRLFYWSHWINQLLVYANNYVDIWYKYNWLSSFQDYIVMFGEWSIWAWYIVWTQVSNSQTVFNLKWQDLINNIWAWSETSIDTNETSVQFIWYDWVIYWLWITPTWTSSWILIPDLQPQTYYMIDHLKRLSNNDIWIHFIIQDRDINIYINNLRYPNNSNNVYTKVLKFNSHHKFWTTWYINGIHINWNTRNWSYYWIWLYQNIWDDDNWNSITQLISCTFWEQTISTTKFFTTSKFILWQDSILTKWSSELKIRLDMWWFSSVIKYDNLWSAQYNINVMKRKDWWFIWELKDWTEIIAWNGVPGWLTTNFNNEFDAFLNYETSMSTILDTNYISQLSKWWRIKFDIAEFADIIYLDIICRWKDRIDFWWLLLWYTQTDIDSERLDNILWLEI